MRLWSVETLSNRVDADAIVDRKDCLICLVKVEMEFLRMTGMAMLNSVSRASNVLSLEVIRWPVWLIWNSWPTTRSPARCRLRAEGLEDERDEMSFVFGDSS